MYSVVILLDGGHLFNEHLLFSLVYTNEVSLIIKAEWDSISELKIIAISLNDNEDIVFIKRLWVSNKPKV